MERKVPRTPGSSSRSRPTFHHAIAEGPIVITRITSDLEVIVSPVRVFRVLLILILALVVLSTAAQALVLYLRDFPLRDGAARLLFVDSEQSLPNIFSSLLLLASALTAGVIARHRRRERQPYARHWFILAIILAFMMVDEFASIHEMSIGPLRRLLSIEGGPLWFAWVVPGAFVTAVVGIAFLRFVGRLPHPTRRQIWVAAIAYLSGAIGFELIGGWHIADHGDANLAALGIVTVEEALEMLGLAVLFHALLTYVGRSMPDVGLRLRVSAA